jgi:hypothetical protein
MFRLLGHGWRWRRSRVATTMGCLVARFDEGTRQRFALGRVFFQFFMEADVLYGIGLLVASTCGLPIETTVGRQTPGVPGPRLPAAHPPTEIPHLLSGAPAWCI